MAKYRKKSEIVEAEQYHAGMEHGFSCIPLVSMCKWPNEDGYFLHCKTCPLDIPKVPFISTLGRKHYISENDWIITESSGERYTCKPDLFKQTYEPVEKKYWVVDPDKLTVELLTNKQDRKADDISPEAYGDCHPYYGQRFKACKQPTIYERMRQLLEISQNKQTEEKSNMTDSKDIDGKIKACENYIMQPFIDGMAEFINKHNEEILAGLTNKQGESNMKNSKDTTSKPYRARFSQSPVNVTARPAIAKLGCYLVTTPNGQTHYLENELFHQLFVEVSPEDDKAAKFTMPDMSVAELDVMDYVTAEYDQTEQAIHERYNARYTAKHNHDCDVIDAGQKSLKERWIPISEAESIDEMREINNNTKCAFCKLYVFPPCHPWSLRTTDCNKCELHDKKQTCCWEYDQWKRYYSNNDYNNAKLAAQAVCRRIKDVIQNAGGII